MGLTLQPGILIALEGIDGAGKTTQLHRLADVFEADGFRVRREKEPTGGKWGQELRASALSGRLSPTKEFRAFIEDRREHVSNVIAPALAAGEIVLVDRYFLSSVAYQGARGLNADRILRANEHFAPKPDAAIILEVPPQVGAARITERGDTQNLFERVEDLAVVARCFAAIDRPYIHRIDGTQSVEAVTTAILRVVAEDPLFQRLCKYPYRPRCEPTYCTARITGNCAYPGLHSLGIPQSGSVAEINRIATDPTLSDSERLQRVTELLTKP